MNGHPITQRAYWQREVEIHYSELVILVREKAWEHMNREIDRTNYVLYPQYIWKAWLSTAFVWLRILMYS